MSSDWYHLEGFIKLHRGQALALASLIKIDGTSYRQVGVLRARMSDDERAAHDANYPFAFPPLDQ